MRGSLRRTSWVRAGGGGWETQRRRQIGGNVESVSCKKKIYHVSRLSCALYHTMSTSINAQPQFFVTNAAQRTAHLLAHEALAHLSRPVEARPPRAQPAAEFVVLVLSPQEERGPLQAAAVQEDGEVSGPKGPHSYLT